MVFVKSQKTMCCTVLFVGLLAITAFMQFNTTPEHVDDSATRVGGNRTIKRTSSFPIGVFFAPLAFVTYGLNGAKVSDGLVNAKLVHSGPLYPFASQVGSASSGACKNGFTVQETQCSGVLSTPLVGKTPFNEVFFVVEAYLCSLVVNLYTNGRLYSTQMLRSGSRYKFHINGTALEVTTSNYHEENTRFIGSISISCHSIRAKNFIMGYRC
ncbi:MAG: hypothetical protein EAY75_09005 [Bacteroidetes bacterium]|nr:MAG: hypothetical protein EAY75_09005 [Bacteroidota bacterium]